MQYLIRLGTSFLLAAAILTAQVINTLDDIALYNRALSEKEINQLMNTGLQEGMTSVEAKEKLVTTWARLKGKNLPIDLAKDLVASIPDAYLLQQFDNPANPEIHERTTAEEIWADCDGLIDCFVSGVGTGGTITGCARALKEKNQTSLL